jgi:hypothetical protein
MCFSGLKRREEEKQKEGRSTCNFRLSYYFDGSTENGLTPSQKETLC